MRLYGLIGKTLKHSFSKGYFTRKFSEEGLTDCQYESFELPGIEAFTGLLRSHPQLCGLNVTIPYKEEVMAYLDEQTEVVKSIGACNCIKIVEGRLKGFNTDVAGFRASIAPQLRPHHKQALVLGTGGASKAICYALGELGISFKLVSRSGGEGRLRYEEVTPALLRQYPLIVNTTPVGMYPAVEEAPSIPYESLGAGHFLYDAIYNPAKTKFLALGEGRGAQISNGYEMLVLQAEESWRIWNEA